MSEPHRCGYCNCACGTPEAIYDGDQPGYCGCASSVFAGDAYIDAEGIQQPERRTQRFSVQEERRARKRPDKQARHEIDAFLNARPVVRTALALEEEIERMEASVGALTARAERAENALEETEKLFGYAIRKVYEQMDLIDSLSHQREALLESLLRMVKIAQAQTTLADFYEHAVKRYAEFAWNDLKREASDLVKQALNA